MCQTKVVKNVPVYDSCQTDTGWGRGVRTVTRVILGNAVTRLSVPYDKIVDYPRVSLPTAHHARQYLEAEKWRYMALMNHLIDHLTNECEFDGPQLKEMLMRHQISIGYLARALGLSIDPNDYLRDREDA